MRLSEIVANGVNAFRRQDLADYAHHLRMGGSLIKILAQRGDIDLALSAEPIWYNGLVKLLETEEHYFRAFATHAPEFYRVGRSIGNTFRFDEEKDENSCAFLLHSGVLLGHTEVMLGILSQWRTKYPWIRPLVLSMHGMQHTLASALKGIGVNYAIAPDTSTPLQRVKFLRDACNSEGIKNAIWVSTPCWVSLVFGYKIAPRQIMWSLKFHPVHMGNDVSHVGMTKPSRGPVTINGAEWLPFSPPLAVGMTKRVPAEIAKVRSQFPPSLLLGTLAREEKFNSPEFLQALVTIMTRAPSAHFLYTGRHDSHQIRETLSNAGLLDRATYIGWVDTNLMSQVIDVFLETFPFGCGVTGAQAVELGTEVISLWGGDTLPTYYFETYEEARSFKKSWRVCASINEYVEAAINSLNSVSNQSTDNQVFQDSLNLSDLDAKKPEQLLRLFGLPTQAPGP